MWKSQLVIPLLESGSESTAQQQPQEQQQQFETEGLSAVEDAGRGRHGHPGGESFPLFAPV